MHHRYFKKSRSIVFRDHLRRAATVATQSPTTFEIPSGSTDAAVRAHQLRQQDLQKLQATAAASTDQINQPKKINKLETITHLASDLLDQSDTVAPSEAGIPETHIAGFQPRIVALPKLGLGPDDVYEKLLQSPSTAPDPDHADDWTPAEREVVEMLRLQRATVKTIKNGSDWTSFLKRFMFAQPRKGYTPTCHDDRAPDPANDVDRHFNSFVTSTSLLPSEGKKMRCFGSLTQYTVGAVFALPEFDTAEQEAKAAQETQTWSWPSGYSAKTEFNIDGNGRLINGREEALRSLETLREYNYEYVNCEEYTVAMRRVSGLSQVPYNEVFLRVGGIGRLVNGKDVSTGQKMTRSFEHGVGLPVALFIRTATFGDLIALLRTRARVVHVLGENHMRGIPLLMICPTNGVRVLTDALQKELWKIVASELNPFQNPQLAHRTTVAHTDEDAFRQKVDELLDLDEDLRELLTPEELAKLAGGFGATDESVAMLLKKVMMEDNKLKKTGTSSHKLQDVVNEGLASAIRSGDYHTSRQLLILYSLVASQPVNGEDEENGDRSLSDSGEERQQKGSHKPKTPSSLGRDVDDLKEEMEALAKEKTNALSTNHVPAPPPPPPLDTDRLRSATNSDGLLAVLGAAQVLKAMQDGSARRRVYEAIDAVEEWVNYGEQSMAFRLSSWMDQRAAQGDLQIATKDSTNFMAFVSNKAITNRKAFAQQLRAAASVTDFNDVRFLQAISEMVSKMRTPCLRLELLQYVLGLDNRYSIAHVARSVELAATCLGISGGQ